MFTFFQQLFDVSDFPPRWHCGSWSAEHGWLHIASDITIWLAYVAIPITLGYFVMHKRDIPFRRVFWLFGMFIMACGTVHLIEAIIFWYPIYRLQGLVKLGTAIVSVATVAALAPIIPRALALRTPEELQHEVQERRKAEALFRALLESAPDAMVIVDQDGRIVLVNSQTANLFCYTSEELMGQSVEILIPERLRDKHPEYRHAFFANPIARPMGAARLLYGRRKNGSEFPVEISLSPQHSPDGRTLVTAAIRDVTDRLEANARLLRSERLAAIGEVVTGLAHEGRNALQQIQSCMAILRAKWTDRPADTQPLLDGVQKAQERLHRMFEDVRVYAAPMQLAPQECDLREVWREAWEQVDIARRGREARLVENIESPDLVCQVDRIRLEQVFRNLFENSLAAGEGPVEISIHCAASDNGSEHLQLRIRDNGPGIDAAVRSRIFEPFFTTKTHGTGLGLPISRRIVDKHGGWLDVGDATTGGAEFVAVLPRIRVDRPLQQSEVEYAP